MNLRPPRHGRHRALIAVGLLALGTLLLAPSVGHTQSVSVPPAVRAEMLKQDITDLLKKEQVKEAIGKFDELRTLQPDLEPAWLYMEARVAAAVDRPNRAARTLEEYFAKASREEASYGRAVALLREVQPKMKVAAQREARAEIEASLAQIPGGTFQMGDLAGDGEPDERPVRTVTIAPFQLGRTEVTVGLFRLFVEATSYQTEAERNVGEPGCFSLNVTAGKREWQAGRSWREPGYPQTDRHPVVCVSWNDVQRFVDWLNEGSQRRIRLTSEAEWEYAARARSATRYPWGDNANDGCRHANGADQTPWPDGRSFSKKMECNDGHFWPAPVGSYLASAFGLHDMTGNVWEWTADCWHESYQGAATDGRARTDGDCARRVSRGGSWGGGPADLRVSFRGRDDAADRGDYRGFRLAQDL